VIGYEIEDVDYWCTRCESAMENTGCISPHCCQYRCLGCGAGCDIELDDGICAHAIHRARIDYMPPVSRPIHIGHVIGDLL
jgi:hypothetical protein